MTQPSDPRKVKVILELIDHTRKIAELNERGDLAERLERARVRISDPQIRVVIAGQLKQGKSQLLNSLLNVPVARVGDDETTVLATVVSYSEQISAQLIVAAPDGGEPTVIPIPPDSLRNDLRRAPEAGGREVLRVEVTASSPLLKRGSGIHRHSRCRRPRPAAPVGHARPSARRRRDADDQRHQPGVHRARDDLHPAGTRNLPGGSHCRDEDRSLSALAADRCGQPVPPRAGRPFASDDPRLVAAAQPRAAGQRQGTQRGIQLSRRRQVPQRAGAFPRGRPDPRSGARRDPFSCRAFDAQGGIPSCRC